LKEDRIYEVTITAINEAGLTSFAQTSPVLFDDSVPTAGHVTEGSEFTDDVVWWGSTDHMNGNK
jgi:hypothetical protein